MGVRSTEEYKAGLSDGRTLFFKGDRVEDVTRHPDLGVGVEHASLDFALAEDAAYQDFDDRLKRLIRAKTISRYFVSPANTDDLLKTARDDRNQHSAWQWGSVADQRDWNRCTVCALLSCQTD